MRPLLPQPVAVNTSFRGSSRAHIRRAFADNRSHFGDIERRAIYVQRAEDDRWIRPPDVTLRGVVAASSGVTPERSAPPPLSIVKTSKFLLELAIFSKVTSSGGDQALGVNPKARIFARTVPLTLWCDSARA